MSGAWRFGGALFDTAPGRCGIAWGDAGGRALQLPEANDALLHGEPVDFTALQLDLRSLPELHRRACDRAAHRARPHAELRPGRRGAGRPQAGFARNS
ncbi:MAG TPA: hypothetical protein PKB14_22210 [Rubrivivax sp.]|nr:hypothetical protein [Rubrivivax sp.]